LAAAIISANASAADTVGCADEIATLEHTVRAKPDSVEAQLTLGVKRFRCGQPAGALEPLRIAIKLSPGNSSAYFYLGTSFLALDREEEARNAFKRMAALTPPSEDEIYLLARGYSKLSSALLERLHDVAPSSYRVHQVEGEYFDSQNRRDLALQQYKLAVQQRPDLPSTHYSLGSAYWAAFESDQAAAEFNEAIRISPQHYMARYKLGMVLLEQNRPADAAIQFREALAVQPGLADAHFGLAKALLHQGETTAALPEIDLSLNIDPAREQAHFLRYQILRKLGREADAEKELASFKELKNRAAKTNEPEALQRY
jgi:tetratricopeptide (TPR) repeat protein